MLSTRASDNLVIIAYLNTVGGQDELVFDGHSLILDQDGAVIARGRQFEEDLIIADIDLEGIMMKRLHAPLRRQEVMKLEKDAVERIVIPVKSHTRGNKPLTPSENVVMEELEEIYRALVLGTSDYISKNGFRDVVIGLSGGIDSAFVAAIAVDALGKDNVKALFMPSSYTSAQSREDAFSACS